MSTVAGRMKRKFEIFSSREKWLTAISGFVVIAGLGGMFVLEPLHQTQLYTEDQLRQTQNSVQEFNLLNESMQKKLSVSPNLELEQKLAALNIEIRDLALQMKNKVDGLVSATKMPLLMESVLKQSKGLTLLSMQSLPAQELAATEEASYYLHEVQLKLRGKFFDIEKYLEKLEALSAKYYWRSIDYRVVNYPWAEFVINVYTLSESPIFIGGANVDIDED